VNNQVGNKVQASHNKTLLWAAAIAMLVYFNGFLSACHSPVLCDHHTVEQTLRPAVIGANFALPYSELNA
jgi:hypothetical protein